MTRLRKKTFDSKVDARMTPQDFKTSWTKRDEHLDRLEDRAFCEVYEAIQPRVTF